MFEYHKKESPIISLLGMGGGIGSYIFTAADTGYEIARSLRFDPSSQSYLDKTFASSGNLTTYTFSFWLKKGINSTFYQNIIIDNDSTSSQIRINDTTGGFELRFAAAGSNAALTTNRKFRDPSAWYHIICVYDSTNATSSDRMRIYVNGVRETSFLAETQPTPSLVSDFMTGGHTYTIGYFNGNTALDGYLADVWFIDGSALEPTEFGTFDDYGVWQPKRYTGSKSGNSFHLPFSDNTSATTLGYDDSGNNNNWDVYNISVWNGGTKMYSVAAFSNSLGYVFTTPGFLPAQSFDGSLTTWAGNNTGGGTNTWTAQSTITVTSSLRVYVVTGAFPSGTTWSVNGVSQGSTSNGWLTATGISTPYTLSTVANTLGSTSTGAFFAAIEVDGSILVDITNPDNDSLLDSPSNDTDTGTGVGGEIKGNYATWNPLTLRVGGGSVSTRNGNLEFGSFSAGYGNYGSILGTLAPSTGKWYVEIQLQGSAVNANDYIGIVSINDWSNTTANLPTVANDSYSFRGDGSTTTRNVNGNYYTSPYTSALNPNDIVGMGINLDDGILKIYVNGVDQGTFPFTISTLGKPYTIWAGDWDNDAFTQSFILNAGQRPFANQNVPSGYKALNTANLPTPTVEDPSQYVGVTTYTGNGTSQTISGLEFSPDLAWFKSRSAAENHVLSDTVRGADRQLFSNLTNAEQTNSTYVTSFTSDGFSLGSNTGTGGNNINGTTYVAWTWDAGSSTVSNTDGSITSSVRANTTAGFSVFNASIPDSASGPTIGHGLGVTPGLVIGKNRDGAVPWHVWHSSFSANQFMDLNSNAAVSTNTSVWGNISSSTIQIGATGTAVNSAWVVSGTQDFIFYAFAPVEGYSAFGSYTGNGSNDGPFVYTGFRPKFLLWKSATIIEQWNIRDASRNTYNPAGSRLFPNLDNAESTANNIDLVSNGFKVRGNSNQENATGETYIYAAFAEHPFRSSRAR